MAYPQGINFRATVGYVTDPTNYDPELEALGAVTYPRTTAQGNTVGWEDGAGSIQCRNRNAGNDPRIAGIHFSGSEILNYRLDLQAPGNYNIGLGAGDPDYAQPVDITLYDTSSSLGAISTGSTSAPQRFNDATDTEYTQVTWPTTQATVVKTFTTTICRVRIAAVSVISTLFVSAVAGTSYFVEKSKFPKFLLRDPVTGANSQP